MASVLSSDLIPSAVAVIVPESLIFTTSTTSLNPSFTDNLQQLLNSYTTISESSTLVTSGAEAGIIKSEPFLPILSDGSISRESSSAPHPHDQPSDDQPPFSINAPDLQDLNVLGGNLPRDISSLSPSPQSGGKPPFDQSHHHRSRPPPPAPGFSNDGSSVSSGLQITISLFTILPLAYIRSTERPRRLLAVWILDLARQFLGYSVCGMFDFMGSEMFYPMVRAVVSDDHPKRQNAQLSPNQPGSGVIPLADAAQIQEKRDLLEKNVPPFPPGPKFFPRDNHGPRRAPDDHGPPWASNNHGSPWVSKNHHGSPWAFKNYYGFLSRHQRTLTQDLFELFPGLIFVYFTNLLFLRLAEYLRVNYKKNGRVQRSRKPSCFISGNFGSPLRLSWFFYQTLIFALSLFTVRLFLRMTIESILPTMFESRSSAEQLLIWFQLDHIPSRFVRDTSLAIISFLVHLLQFAIVDKMLKYRSSSMAAYKRIDESSVSDLIRTTRQRQNCAEDSNWVDVDQDINNNTNIDHQQDLAANHQELAEEELSWESWVYKELVHILKSLFEDDHPRQYRIRRNNGVLIDEESGLESYELNNFVHSQSRVSTDQHHLSDSQPINANISNNNNVNPTETTIRSTMMNDYLSSHANSSPTTNIRPVLGNDLKIFVKDPPSPPLGSQETLANSQIICNNTDDISDASIDVDLLTARLLNTVAISATAQTRPYLFSSDTHTRTGVPLAQDSELLPVAPTLIHSSVPLDLGGVRLNLDSDVVRVYNNRYNSNFDNNGGNNDDDDIYSDGVNSDSADSFTSVSTSTSSNTSHHTDNSADDTRSSETEEEDDLARVTLPSYDDSQRQHAELLRNTARSRRQQAVISDLKSR